MFEQMLIIFPQSNIKIVTTIFFFYPHFSNFFTIPMFLFVFAWAQEIHRHDVKKEWKRYSFTARKKFSVLYSLKSSTLRRAKARLWHESAWKKKKSTFACVTASRRSGWKVQHTCTSFVTVRALQVNQAGRCWLRDVNPQIEFAKTEFTLIHVSFVDEYY